MHEHALPAGSFYGRKQELGAARRLIEGRTGGQLGFIGLGGMGKSTLLAQIAVEAQKLAVTPYIVSVAIEPDLTPVAFLRAVLDGLRATGATTRRRAMFFTEDTLKECDSLLRRLEQQDVHLTRRMYTDVSARDQAKIGNVTVVLQEQDSTDSTVLLRDFLSAFTRLVGKELPQTVSMPHNDGNYIPQRLLVLLVDNVEQAQPELLKLLLSLRSGQFTERVLLFCAGRNEPAATTAEQRLLTRELVQLDAPVCAAWLTRAGVTDQALRTAIIMLCQGVPLLIRLCLNTIDAAQAAGNTLTATDFQLAPPGQGGAPARDVVEQFLVQRFIERLEQLGGEGRQLSALVRYGCVLRSFRDHGALRALQIPGMSPDSDIDPLLRALASRNLLSNATLHSVVRQAALMRLASSDPVQFRTLSTRAAAYYAAIDQPDEHVALLVQANSPDAVAVFEAAVATALAQDNLLMVDRLIRAAEPGATNAALQWAIRLAQVDRAIAQQDQTQAEAWLVQALPLLADDPERLQALEQRITALQPLRNGTLLLWWLPRQPDSAEVLAQLLALSEAFRKAYQYAPAFALAQQALAMAKRVGDQPGTATALLSLGDALLQQAAPREAQGYSEQALAAYRAIDDRLGTANALWSLGEALRMQDAPQEAQGYSEQALAAYRAIDDRLGTANALWSLGEALRMQDAPQEAQGYYEQALAAYRAIDHRLGTATALLSLGDALLQQAAPQEAQGYYEQALAAYRAIDDRLGTATALLRLGDALLQQAAPREAQGYLEQALAAYRAIDDRLGTATALLRLGDALRMQAAPREAQGYSEQALAAYRAIDDRLGTANALRSLGDALRMQDAPQEAQGYYEQALAAYRAIDDRRGTATALLSLGEALLQQAAPREAQGYLEQALAAYRAIDDRLGTATALLRLGEARWAQGAAAQAQQYLTEAIKVARQIEYKAVQFNALKTLIVIAEAAQDYEEVREYKLQYQHLLVENRR
jgi:tetratricopeptide (TPR) repeat protein